MSTATPQPTQAPIAPLPLLRAAARTMFVGLLWGGVLLLILGWWLGLKFAAEERSAVMAWIVGAAGVIGLALAGWHAVVLWLQKATPEQQAPGLTKLRRITGFALLAGGAALLVLAVLIGFSPRPGGTGGWASLKSMFGEAVGLFLFALVVIGAGRSLLSPPRDDLTTVDLESVRNLFPLIRAALFIVGAIALGAFLVLAFYQKIGIAHFPELAALLLFSMLCFALGLWLLSTPSPDAFITRVFVLIFGGTSGLILFLMAIGLAVAWRNEVFLGGMAVWQGEGSWQLWLCVYVQLIALALMFGSLLLARADIRSNALLRRVLFGYNTVLNGLLIVEMLLVINIVFYALVPYRFDWTSTRGLHALAQSSMNLLHKLERPTHIYVLLSSNMAAQTDVRGLLDNLQAESNKVDVTYVSPDRDVDTYAKLREVFPKILPASGVVRLNEESGRGLLIVYGELPKTKEHKVPYAFIPERKIYDTNMGGMHGQRESKSFKGEVEVIREINYLVGGGERRKLYFLQGDDEIDVFDSQVMRRDDPRFELSLLGASMLVDKLKKDNYDVEAITFSKDYANDPKRKTEKIRYVGPDAKDPAAHIPNDAYAVVIAGASSQVPREGITALEKYVERGGKLMVLFDIVLTKAVKVADLGFRESGLEDMVKKFGIASTDEYALTQITSQTRDPFKVPAMPPEKTENALAKQFAGRLMWFRWARVLRLAAAGRYKAEPVYTSIGWRPGLPIPMTIGQRGIAGLRDPINAFDEARQGGDLRRLAMEELPFVVGVSEDTKPRMVVFGDTEFISNLGMMSADRTDNYALFVSSLEWMAEHQSGKMGPEPKESQIVTMPPDVALQYTRIHLVPLWIMFLCIVGLGGGIWLVRRR